ncbi:islet cell autoantigen 1-like isoform X1 [Leuresthes tenuis]|uniref:islet cell autoantigen 1-like isoform X1 n=1 Tax=Leuresthes tenuis TaxID=355514 RepID=UPI003B500970
MMDGFAGEMLNSGRALLGEDSSVMARMQKKFWKTKQVLIKATGKKEDEYVVASDADLDAKLEFFRSVQFTCTELLKVIEKYQYRITRLSQEENELGLFLRFQAEHDRTKAGNMMDATSKALCTSAKQRMALCPPLHRMHQEVETFRRRAIADTLLTVSRMEKARTEYRGALLWMKDVSQELDPDTYKQLEKFRKVQAQVRGTKSQFEKLKNDVCQKVDMLGASRCNMLSHSLCTYQTTLLQFWEKTAHTMSGIHEAFQGHIPYQFTTLKDLRDPLEQISDSQNQEEKKEKALQSNTDSLVSLDDDKPSGSASNADFTLNSDGQSQASDSALHDLRRLSADSNDDLMLMACSIPHPQPLSPTNPPLQPQLLTLSHAGDQNELSSFGSLQSDLLQMPVAGSSLLSGGLPLPSETGLKLEEEDGERSDMAFLKDLLSLGPGASDEFSKEWQDAFGMFDPPSIPAASTGAATGGAATGGAATGGATTGGVAAAHTSSNPPSPTGFLPSQLLDHSLSSTGWVTPPMFQAPPLQTPSGQNQTAPRTLSSAANAASGGSKDMSAWFNLFADLDPLSNPDAIGRSADELLNA